jgi:hypothetical protein
MAKAIFTLDLLFEDTKKKEFVTFGGWDGTGYNGEGKNVPVYTHKENGKRYVRTYNRGWRCYHEITDQKHPASGAYKLDTCAFMGDTLNK